MSVNCDWSRYGLGCSILSRDVARAEKIGRRVESGMVTVNDYGVSYLVQGLPFGGCKYSGFGRFNGPEGLRGFAREQTVVSDKYECGRGTSKIKFICILVLIYLF